MTSVKGVSTPFRVVPLEAQYNRELFSCGTPALDQYFRTQVSQDVKRRVTSCFVALATDSSVAGFYTLAATSVVLTDLPANNAKKLPRYPLVPAVRMGRLAVSSTHQGLGLGAALLANALQRAASADIAAYAFVVDAKDDQAARFYSHHGFISLPDAALTLFLPLAGVALWLDEASV